MSRFRHRRDEGVAAVELALVLPVFLALTLGLIDFALAFRQQIMLRDAASNAATYAAVQPCDTTTITQDATDEIQNVSVLKPTNPVVTLSFTDSSGTVLTTSDACSTASQVEVSVSAPYDLLTGSFLSLFGVPSSLTVSGQETVQIQGRTT